jgi:disulfide bond formation protein DsbB
MLFSPKIARLLIVFFFLVSVCFSFGVEYLFDVKPCLLCSYLRYLYIAILTVAVVFYFYPQPLVFVIKLALIVAATGLSFYHLGIEQHWWDGPSVCSGKSFSLSKLQGLSDDEKSQHLLEHFKAGQMVPCNQVNWRIIGISATIWNTTLLMFLLAGIGFLWKRNKI